MHARDITIQQENKGLADQQFDELASKLDVNHKVLNTLLAIVQTEDIASQDHYAALHEMAQAQKRGELLGARVHVLQIRAVELIREGRAGQALDTLREGERLLKALIDDDPSNVMSQVQKGFFYKTLAQAYEEAGDKETADDRLDVASATFQQVRNEVPTDRKTVAELASAINGLGNVYYQRGNYDKAIQNYSLAVELDPTYAYAWHDLFGAYYALAKRGKVNLVAMCRAFEKVKETGRGVDGLSDDYIRLLGDWLKEFDEAPNK